MLPAVTVVSFLPVFLHFVTDSRMFWVFGSLFQRRCGVFLASCCGSGNQFLSRRCGVLPASCCGSGNISSTYLFWRLSLILSCVVSLAA